AEWLPVEEPFFSEDAGDYEVHYSNNLDSGKVYVRILVPFAPGVDPSDLTFVRAKLTLDGSPFTGSLTHTLIDPEGESHSLDSTISATATDEYLLQVAFSVEDEADIDDIALVDIVYGLEGEMGSFVHTFTIPIAMDEETVSNRKQDPDTGGTKSDGGGGSGCDAGFGLFALFLAAIPMAARKRS
ncbi:MAG: SYNERG-CTERM sorting domain-containing protein, partial [Synergistaceae bacterium]|nr:SYNERG-CTERM sorting domain-containing protein [Synergistaceae bacterium]